MSQSPLPPPIAPLTLAEYKAQLVSVPGGTFSMGSDEGLGYEQPIHSVTLSPFRLGRTPVTVGMWKEYADATLGGQMPSAPPWGWVSDHPMVNVSWEDCQAFAEWAGLALPTGAQWEYAARGPEGLEYPWGNEWDGRKCVNSVGSNSLSGTVPVGSLASGVSWYGALDLSGNVWEWCSDWYGAYTKGSVTDPVGPSSGTCNVLRGASWYDSGAEFFRGADRDYDYPFFWFDYVGFRLSAGP